MTNEDKCGYCDGNGWVEADYETNEACEQCNGTGYAGVVANLLYCVPCTTYLPNPVNGQELAGVTSLRSTAHETSCFNWGFEFEVVNPLKLQQISARLSVECGGKDVGTAVYALSRGRNLNADLSCSEIWSLFAPINVTTVTTGFYRVGCYLATGQQGPFTRCHGAGKMYVTVER